MTETPAPPSQGQRPVAGRVRVVTSEPIRIERSGRLPISARLAYVVNRRPVMLLAAAAVLGAAALLLASRRR